MPKSAHSTTNQTKIDTYLDTSKKINRYFPQSLKNKLLLVDDSIFFMQLGIRNEYYTKLRKYLRERNPKHLLDAVKINNSVIFYGKQNYEEFKRNLSINAKFDDFNPYRGINKLPDYVIIWETINDWETIIALEGKNKDHIYYVENFLSQISPLLLNYSPEEQIIAKTKDGLMHILTRKPQGNSKVTYQKAEEFRENIEKIQAICKKYSKKLYNTTYSTREEELSNELKPLLPCILSSDFKTSKLGQISDVARLFAINHIRLVEHELHIINSQKKISNLMSTIKKIFLQSCKKGMSGQFIYRLYREAKILNN